MSDTTSYTPTEVSKILKISRFTVYEMIKRGDLAAYHIGRNVRVEAPDLEEYIQKSKKSAFSHLKSAVLLPDQQRQELATD